MPVQIPNTKIVGAEWVNDYDYPFVPRRSSLQRCHQNAIDFRTILSLSQGSNPPGFIYGDDQAWDQDFEQNFANTSEIEDAFAPPAFTEGDDDRFAETVDILFFSGHGTQDGLLFGVPGRDNGEAKYDEIMLGQKGKLKWFAADACRVLEDLEPPNEGAAAFRWGSAFRGLRYLLSFHKDCRDVINRGKVFAQYLKGTHPSQLQLNTIVGETISRAWELACIETEDAATLTWAHLRPGDQHSVIRNDRWTDNSVPKDETSPPRVFTYTRHIPPPSSTN